MSELLHLSWLAHLAFEKMMPNDRGIEMHRFNDEDDAQQGTRAIERLELAIPARAQAFRRSPRAVRQPARIDSELVAVAAQNRMAKPRRNFIAGDPAAPGVVMLSNDASCR
jgi:hypothetical protein